METDNVCASGRRVPQDGELLDAILALKKTNPDWGYKKMTHKLREMHDWELGFPRVRKVFLKNGLLSNSEKNSANSQQIYGDNPQPAPFPFLKDVLPPKPKLSQKKGTKREGMLGAMDTAYSDLKEIWSKHCNNIMEMWCNPGDQEWREKILNVAFDVSHKKIGNCLVVITQDNLLKICPEVMESQLKRLAQIPQSLVSFFEKVVNSSEQSDAKILKTIARSDPSLNEVTFFMRGWIFYFDGGVEGRADGSKKEAQDMIDGVPLTYIIQRRQFLADFLITFFQLLPTFKHSLTEVDKVGKRLMKKSTERKNKFPWVPTDQSQLRVRVQPNMYLNLPSLNHFGKIKITSNEFRVQLKEMWAKNSREFRTKWATWPAKTREVEFCQCVQKISSVDYDVFDGNMAVIYDVIVPEMDPKILSETSEALPELTTLAVTGNLLKTEPNRNVHIWKKLKEHAKNAKWPTELGPVECEVAREECFPHIRQIVICKVLSIFIQSVLDDYDENGNFDQERAMHSMLVKHFGGDAEAMKKMLESLEKGNLKT